MADEPKSKGMSQRDRVMVMAAEKMAPIHEAIRKAEQEKMLQALFDKSHIKTIDRWIAQQNDPSIDLPEAVRRLVEIGLMVKK
jgi:hypothetical protein